MLGLVQAGNSLSRYPTFARAILAIKTFQAVVMSMNPPSGHVAPASPTYHALAARPLVSRKPPPQIRFGHVGILPPDVIAAAKASQSR